MRILGLVLAGLLLAIPARAVTSYNSLASMQAANPALTFENLSFGATLTADDEFVFTDDGFNFVFSTVTSNGLTTVAAAPGWPAMTILRTNGNGVTFTLSLPAQVIAFGATFGWTSTQSGFAAITEVTVSGNDGAAFSRTLIPGAANTPLYLGLVGSGSFSSITISSNVTQARFGLNNFSYALAPGGMDIPEPSTFALIGTGLLMLPLLHKRLRKSRDAQPR